MDHDSRTNIGFLILTFYIVATSLELPIEHPLSPPQHPMNSAEKRRYYQAAIWRQRKLIKKPILGSDHCSFGGSWKCRKELCCSPSLAPHPGTLIPCYFFHFHVFLIFIFAPYPGTCPIPALINNRTFHWEVESPFLADGVQIFLDFGVLGNPCKWTPPPEVFRVNFGLASMGQEEQLLFLVSFIHPAFGTRCVRMVTSSSQQAARQHPLERNGTESFVDVALLPLLQGQSSEVQARW